MDYFLNSASCSISSDVSFGLTENCDTGNCAFLFDSCNDLENWQQPIYTR